MDLAYFQIFTLAVIQGVAEFLPISSSGHVVVTASLFGGKQESLDAADLNIVLHVGTLGSIVVIYFDRIRKLLREDRKLIVYLAVATVPAVLVGVPLKKYCEHWLASPLLAGFLLIGTGLLLICGTRWAQNANKENEQEANPTGLSEITLGRALLIGCAQALAILPGLSRSGLTITTGMALRLSAKRAATFSFLMAIPVIAGGGILEIATLMGEAKAVSAPLTHLIMGGAVAMLVGILSLRFLLQCLDSGRFHWFAYWCIPFGIFAIYWNWTA